jgi:Ni,Fe-hydrogenase maturation factor
MDRETIKKFLAKVTAEQRITHTKIMEQMHIHRHEYFGYMSIEMKRLERFSKFLGIQKWKAKQRLTEPLSPEEEKEIEEASKQIERERTEFYIS